MEGAQGEIVGEEVGRGRDGSKERLMSMKIIERFLPYLYRRCGGGELVPVYTRV